MTVAYLMLQAAVDWLAHKQHLTFQEQRWLMDLRTMLVTAPPYPEKKD